MNQRRIPCQTFCTTFGTATSEIATTGPRKNYDNPQYRSTDRHSGRDKRGGAQRKPHPSEHLTLIKKILEEIQESQRELVRAARERTAAEKRMADALEAIAGHFSGSQLAAAPSPAPAEPVDTETTPLTEAAPAEADPAETAADAPDDSEPTDETARNRRETAMSLIQELRSKGMAYEKIARHLEAKQTSRRFRAAADGAGRPSASCWPKPDASKPDASAASSAQGKPGADEEPHQGQEKGR